MYTCIHKSAANSKENKMLLKHRMLRGLWWGLVTVSFGALSQQDDIRQNREREVTLQELPNKYLIAHQRVGYLSSNQDVFPKADLVVFYQPSYASTYGEYFMHKRIPQFVNTLNEAIAAHGLKDYQVVIKDVVPVESVDDNIPYLDVVDSNGNVIEDGADYLFSVAALNEASYVNGEWVNNPEYHIYQEKWKADLVLYLREFREGDKHLGLAGIGGESSSALDVGGDASVNTTIAHEIGHNFGMNHEEAKADVGPDYARAWECAGKQTIMYSASSESTTLRHFSDPNISNGGELCGDEEVGYNAKILVDNYLTTTQRRGGVESLGLVSFALSEFNGNETDGVEIVLTRTGDLSESASVKVFAENGTAVWGEDFTDVYMLAEFAEGESQSTVIFPIVDDGGEEGAETFGVYLQYPYKLSVGEVSTASVTVFDGDNNGVGGMISISGPAELEEGQDGTLLVSRNGGAGEVIVNVSASSEDATPGVDYVPLNKQLVFSEGEVEKSVTFTASDDLEAEMSEVVVVNVSSPNNGVTYSQESLSITILDDDAVGAGVFGLSSQTSSASEGSGSVSVSVSRDGGFAAAELSIEVDVKGAKQTLPVSFSENEMEKAVSVNISDNNTDEADYSMTLTLVSEDPGVTIATSEITLTIVDDDSVTSSPSNGGDSSSGGGSTGIWTLLLGFGVAVSRFRMRKRG